MKNVYIKTSWIDNKTPINAANMNKIENAISEFSEKMQDIGKYVYEQHPNATTNPFENVTNNPFSNTSNNNDVSEAEVVS